MTTDEQPPPPAAVESLRVQLHALAGAAGLPVPELRIDPPRAQDRLPRVVSGAVVVPRGLLQAAPARQLWELAACLGRLSSSVPDQRRRTGGIALAALLAALLILIFARPTSWIWITPVLLYPVGFALQRWERRAMDDAGRRVLAAAGHRPATVAEQAFAGEPDPPGLRAWLSAEPSPSSRVRAAQADRRTDPSA